VGKVHASYRLERWVVAIFSIVALGLSGCGSGSSSPHSTGGVTIAFTQAPPTTLAANATASMSATVSNDTANAGVDWSCAPAGSCGSFSPAHTASGAATTFTAPASAGSVTITAASTTSHSTTAVGMVSISAATSSIAIAFTSPAPTSVVVGGSTTLNATVTNDTANAGVDWTCTPTGTCGTFTPAHTASGANTTYTAPGAAVAAVVTASATSHPATTATANIAVSAANAAALTTGSYSFYVGGEDSKKDTYAIAGAFVLAANGVVSGGEQDYVSSSGGATSPQPSGDVILSGTLTVGANGVGTLTLVTNNASVGVAGTETFTVSEVNSKHAVIGEFDSSATSTGSLDLQTLVTPSTLAAVNGPFAFTVSGKNGAAVEVFGGVFSSNGAGVLTISDLDSNEAGTINRGGTNVGAYTAPDAAGRGTMTFGGNHFVYYLVNAKVLRIVVVDANEPDLGSAYTGVSGITNASLNSSYVFTDASTFASGSKFAAAGKLTLNGSGNVTAGFADVDENGTSTSTAVTGTYSVNASGYGTLTLTPGNAQDISVLGLYLTDPTINPTDPNSAADAGLAGLLLDLDAAKLTGGGWLIVPAAGTPTFTSGNFVIGGQASTTTANELDSVGVVAVNGTALTGAVNVNDLFATVNTGQNSAAAISGTLVPDSVNAGRFTISVAETLGGTPPTLKYVVYQASNSQLVVVEVDSSQFASGTIQKQQ